MDCLIHSPEAFMRRKFDFALGLGFSLLALVSGCAQTSNGSVCSQAAAKINSCGGNAQVPASCDGDSLSAAQQVLGLECDDLNTQQGKSDGFWCLPVVSWLGKCATPLSDVAKMPALTDVCNGSTDSLCAALTASDYSTARDLVSARVKSEDRTTLVADPVVRYYLRERVVSLFAYNVGQSSGLAVDDILKNQYPAYDPSVFSMAHAGLTPTAAISSACTKPTEALFLFPGVIRNSDRQEFARPGEQMEALNKALPCLRTVRVESGSFVEPSKNAAQAKKQIDALDAELGPIPLHFLGYSQGSTNALTTLATYPELAARVASVITMNSAAHGSEVGDTMLKVIDLSSKLDCSNLPAFAQGACKKFAGTALPTQDNVLSAMATAFGMTLDQLKTFTEAEDDVQPATNFSQFFFQHLDGISSLTTPTAAAFWASSGLSLPQHTLYMSFRSAIVDDKVSDPNSDLPASNELFYDILTGVDSKVPYNDMQVRLVNQSLNASVADREVMLPVAVGNHWLWELTPAAVPNSLMATTMFSHAHRDEMFMAFYQTLAETGILFGNPQPQPLTTPDLGEVADLGSDLGGANLDGGVHPDLSGNADLSPVTTPVVNTPSSTYGASSGGCDFGGAPISGSAILLAIALTAIISRRRRV